MTVLNLRKKTPKLGESYLEDERLNEINRLAEQLTKSRSDMRLLSIELRQIEREINNFLDEYYGSLGDVLVNKAKDPITTINPANFNSPAKEEFSINDSLNDMIKKLYKKLSKMCHPDLQVNNSISKFFTNINDAYNKKNLQELLRIEEYLSGENDNESVSPKEKLERLSAEYDEVLEKIKDLQNTKESLLQSPEYELKRRVLWAKMCGEDLICKIKNDLYKQLQCAGSES